MMRPCMLKHVHMNILEQGVEMCHTRPRDINGLKEME